MFYIGISTKEFVETNAMGERERFFFLNHEELFSMQLGIVISHYHNISKCSNFYYH